MKSKYLAVAVGLALSLCAASAHAQQGVRYSHTGPTLISDVRIIDGLGNMPWESQDILFAEGRIAAIGRAGTLGGTGGLVGGRWDGRERASREVPDTQHSISDTRNVRHVFLRGNQVDRDSLKLNGDAR